MSNEKSGDSGIPPVVSQQAGILDKIITSINAARRSRGLNLHKAGKRLKDLREEAARAKEADLPALFDQMNAQRALIEHDPGQALPDIRSPYFAHMELEEEGRRRHVLLGYQTFLECQGLPVIDWRHAPVSRIFFNYREGEEYEEELPGRIAEGVVISRHILTIRGGRLMRVQAGGGEGWMLNEAGQWTGDRQSLMPDLQGGEGQASRGQASGPGTGQGGRPAPEVAALLDRDQYRLLSEDDGEPLLILGGAGCGKTTVALHRLASLNYKEPGRFAPKKMLVVVPEEGLRRLSSRILGGLGIGAAPVTTFAAWAARQAWFCLGGLPKKVCQDTPGDVVRIKRHPAFLEAFALLARDRAAGIAEDIRRRFQGKDDIAGQLMELVTELPLLGAIEETSRRHLGQLKGNGNEMGKRRQVVREFYQNVKKELLDFKKLRTDLFSHEPYLQAVVQASAGLPGGRLPAGCVKRVLSHTLDQLDGGSANRYGGVDADRLETVDGRNLRKGDDGIAGTIDSEDFALLLELLQFLTGGEDAKSRRLERKTAVVIDEAQDLAPVELRVMGRSFAPGGAVTVAGDDAQQTDETVAFESWEQTVATLGLPAMHANHLVTTYRSTREIAMWAHKVLGPAAPATPPATIRSGARVARSHYLNEGHATIFLNEALTNLMIREPGATVAVISRDRPGTLRLWNNLKDVPRIRVVEGGEFSFQPGIDLTYAARVKGLEFDYVIVPDAGAAAWPDTPESRRLMHLAASRAIHQLWIISIGQASPILPAGDK